MLTGDRADPRSSEAAWTANQGSASDIAIQAKEILRWRERLNELYVKHTKQSLKVIGTASGRGGRGPQ